MDLVLCNNAESCPIADGCVHGRPHKEKAWKIKEEQMKCTIAGECTMKNGKNIEVLTNIKCVKTKEEEVSK